MRNQIEYIPPPRQIPITGGCTFKSKASWYIKNKKVNSEEKIENQRSRSAILRVLEKK